MSAPDRDAVSSYLGEGQSWSTEELDAVIAAERAAQAQRCDVPAEGDEWPADLAEALCRRVARNLAMRGLPLGQTTGGDAPGVPIGRRDPEVDRLEAPYRPVLFG